MKKQQKYFLYDYNFLSTFFSTNLGQLVLFLGNEWFQGSKRSFLTMRGQHINNSIEIQKFKNVYTIFIYKGKKLIFHPNNNFEPNVQKIYFYCRKKYVLLSILRSINFYGQNVSNVLKVHFWLPSWTRAFLNFYKHPKYAEYA